MKSLKWIRRWLQEICEENPMEFGDYDSWAQATETDWSLLVDALDIEGASFDFEFDENGFRSGLAVRLANGHRVRVADPLEGDEESVADAEASITECATDIYNIQRKYKRASRAASRAFKRALAGKKAPSHALRLGRLLSEHLPETNEEEFERVLAAINHSSIPPHPRRHRTRRSRQELNMQTITFTPRQQAVIGWLKPSELDQAITIDRMADLMGIETPEDMWDKYWSFNLVGDDEESEQAELDELWKNYVNTMIACFEELLEKFKLEIVQPNPEVYDWVLKPTETWEAAAEEIRETINGVGMFYFSDLKDFLRSGPYTAKAVVLTHLHWMKRYYDVYEGSKMSSVFNRRLR